MKKIKDHRIIILSTMTLLITLFLVTVYIVNAEGMTSSQQEASTTNGIFVSELDEDTEFNTGVDFLNQAWIDIENKRTELAKANFVEANIHFSNALTLNPSNILTLINRATAYIGLEEYDKALEDFDKVLELDPLFPSAYEGKSLVYEIQGEVEKFKESLEILDSIYNTLISQAANNDLGLPNISPSPDSLYSTWYASNAKHNYVNRFTGQTIINASGFGCGISAPWKTYVENAVYFSLPWNTWGRYTEGLKATGYLHWVNLSGNTQGYTNSGAFLGWTVPANENYVLLISETEVCSGFWGAVPSYYRISANYY